MAGVAKHWSTGGESYPLCGHGAYRGILLPRNPPPPSCWCCGSSVVDDAHACPKERPIAPKVAVEALRPT